MSSPLAEAFLMDSLTVVMKLQNLDTNQLDICVL